MSSAHQLRVLKLYRHSLKNLLSWTVDRGMYRQKAMELRARFEATRFEKNIVKATQLVEAGEAELDEIKHPNPYVAPTSLDGTKWERNMPPPAEVCKMSAEDEAWFNDKRNWA